MTINLVQHLPQRGENFQLDQHIVFTFEIHVETVQDTSNEPFPCTGRVAQKVHQTGVQSHEGRLEAYQRCMTTSLWEKQRQG